VIVLCRIQARFDAGCLLSGLLRSYHSEQMARLAPLVCLALCALTARADDDGLKSDLQIAAAEVQRETGGKILSATKIESGRRAMFRIKVLTEDGQVRVIQIPERRIERVRREAVAGASDNDEPPADQKQSEEPEN
jgi:hypothetical protein